MSYAAKRKIELECKRKMAEEEQKSRKKSKLSANERLAEGMNKAIGQDNKGFSMLQKMGYKPGTSLGKEGEPT